jgi:hypothetical protein
MYLLKLAFQKYAIGEVGGGRFHEQCLLLC